MNAEKREHGILKQDWDRIISVFSSNPKIKKAILFGSRAKGSFSNGSDIDIALKGEGLNLDDILDVNMKYEMLSLPYKLDIVLYDRINEKALIEHINRVGVILYDRDTKD